MNCFGVTIRTGYATVPIPLFGSVQWNLRPGSALDTMREAGPVDSSPEDITFLLSELQNGDQEAASKLMPLVYNELRRLASGYMRRERAEHTLQATALVHEAYLKLVKQRSVNWQGRSHFFGIAAQLMRRILIDHAGVT